MLLGVVVLRRPWDDAGNDVRTDAWDDGQAVLVLVALPVTTDAFRADAEAGDDYWLHALHVP